MLLSKVSTGIDTANTILAHSAPKALDGRCFESNEPIPQDLTQSWLQTLLNRVGVAKKESINVNHNQWRNLYLSKKALLWASR